jgi:hypothetical protein
MHAAVDIPSRRPRVVLNGDLVPSVAAYHARGGGEGLRVARSLGPWRTAEEVTLSGRALGAAPNCSPSGRSGRIADGATPTRGDPPAAQLLRWRATQRSGRVLSATTIPTVTMSKYRR